MLYTFSTWLFFFYFYCFIGWVWETLYVSVLRGRWVNRGFIHGPFLPLYGFGAIEVLVFTLPCRDDAGVVFVVGMASATLLEYFTGVAMEKLFHVRYWDYSDKPCNLNGHICLMSSLAWGVFSVILTLYGHAPVERMALSMNQNLLEFIVFILTAYIAIDTEVSVREAFNLREFLEALEQSNDDLKHLQKGFEVAYAFYGNGIKEKSEAGLRKINSALGSGKEKYGNTKSAILERIEETREGRTYKRIGLLLGRNPRAVSKMHEAAFGEFKELLNERRKAHPEKKEH
ncbi:MAG: putative ABC transporter permease [Lachnospiraceae bacterium]|nr:putative ABC transporter permease [Lachnospiraceae bacterium]